MEKRICVISLLINGKESVPNVNQVLSNHSDIILARQGLPIRDKNIQVISLIVEGTTDQISALNGPMGKLPGVQVKSVLTNYREETNDHNFT